MANEVLNMLSIDDVSRVKDTVTSKNFLSQDIEDDSEEQKFDDLEEKNLFIHLRYNNADYSFDTSHFIKSTKLFYDEFRYWYESQMFQVDSPPPDGIV